MGGCFDGAHPLLSAARTTREGNALAWLDPNDAPLRAHTFLRRFGFVQFYSGDVAKAAREAMHHTQVDGRRVEVNWATRRVGPPRDRSRYQYQSTGGGMGMPPMGMGMPPMGAPPAWGYGYPGYGYDPNAAAAWQSYYGGWGAYYGQPGAAPGAPPAAAAAAAAAAPAGGAAADPYAAYYAQYYGQQQAAQVRARFLPLFLASVSCSPACAMCILDCAFVGCVWFCWFSLCCSEQWPLGLCTGSFRSCLLAEGLLPGVCDCRWMHKACAAKLNENTGGFGWPLRAALPLAPLSRNTSRDSEHSCRVGKVVP